MRRSKILLVVLFGLLLLLEYQRLVLPLHKDKFLEIVIGTYWTVLGIYLAFELTRQFESFRARTEFVNSLKPVHLELTFQLQQLKVLLRGFKEMPHDLSRMHDRLEYLIDTYPSEGLLKTREVVFNSNYDLDNMAEMNALQLALYNYELMWSGLKATSGLMEEYKGIDSNRIPEELATYAVFVVKEDAKKIFRTISLIEDANDLVSEKLRKRGFELASEQAKDE